METVGIRELKKDLSSYLRKVKTGDKIIITDRKKQLLLSPCKIENTELKALQLIQRGIVQWSGGKPSGLSSRINLKGKSVSDAVLEGRRQLMILYLDTSSLVKLYVEEKNSSKIAESQLSL